jgi:hypothetical protein
MATLEGLPAVVQATCLRLRDGLLPILRDNLIALWTYGSNTFADPPVFGDVDTYAILAGPCPRESGRRIETLHRSTEADLGVETDSWYILLEDAKKSAPPPHALRPDLMDFWWALHRAHLLAGRCAVVHGAKPHAILVPPTWPELERALAYELGRIEENWASQERRTIPGVAPYAVLNCCRIAYSVESQDVVKSKRESGLWALMRFPSEWHVLIRAAQRWYDHAEEPYDGGLLQERTLGFLSFVRERSGL